MKETNICSDDIIRAFISRRVLPLKRRAHKMSEMYDPGDPTKITGLPLSKDDIVLKARQICQTAMRDDWEWGFLPLSSTNPLTQEAKDRFPRIEADRRGPCRKRPLDAVDPDPYIHWTDLKMGRTHTSRPATRGLGKDRLPAPDPAGPRCSEEHFMRLRRAVKELDSAWYDATNNMMTTADARKILFEELLWELRDLPEAHSKCQAIPEASIEALRTQLAALQDEKEQLIRQHREALDAQETYSKGLKDQLIQLGLEHSKALKAAQATAEAKLNEALEDASNSTVVLRAELEEAAKARKAAEDQTARLEAEQKEYDLLAYAQKKVGERRVAQAYKNLDAPWDPYDHLVVLSAQVSHMRAVDRNLADIPEVAIQLFKVLWPGEEVPDNLSLTNDRLKGAGWRIREWQCSAARAGADSALRVACSWYPNLDLDALIGVREQAPTDLDPVLTAKRQDRAYRIAKYAAMRTFIPPPPDVKDYLDDEGR
ncbi:hypothetical protein QYE76_005331 [Lolium multiflorum]|uniref:Uncharacterized protein n=1 Tax=Lolium multiflorum TaxID=4521 RepID=A0AAD8RW85_LOLMU|nr:hypothetical protein QYE76_005331 [Lolium multiflorum]